AQSAPVTAVDTDVPMLRQYPTDLESLLIDLDFPSMAANYNNTTNEWAELIQDKVPTPTPNPDDLDDEN
ncbi:MAG: hypothetical protein F6K39_44555, partial [Okeania sp. SIO3B3]|nr:hypothetical protein [Okeania sp. SIO3B3]